MITDNLVISPEMASKMGDTLSQIGTDMLSIQAILTGMVEQGGFDHAHAAIEVLSARSGALADSLNEQVGGPCCVGDIADWFKRI
jgi:hypothetical protein